MLNDSLIIGKKGEILPKKQLREMSGIKPGDQVYIEAYPGKIIIRKIATFDELLKRPIIEELTEEKLGNDLYEEGLLQEELTVTKLNKHIR